MEKKKGKQKLRILSWILFVAYLLLLFYLLFFSVDYGRTMENQGYRYNLALFKEIKRFWLNKDMLGWNNVLINLAGNIIAFAPFGYCLAVLTKRGKNLFFCTFGTAFFSLLMELIQLVSKVGAFDVDDIFLNALGGLLGGIMYYVIGRPAEEYFDKLEEETTEQKESE